MYCRGFVSPSKEGGFRDLTLRGKIIDGVADGKIRYIAAAGADRRASYAGSGLPFANQIQAFDNTPNAGFATLDTDNSFEIRLVTPNSYMIGLGSVSIPPTVFLSYKTLDNQTRNISVRVADPIPYRLLTYPLDPRPRKDATFYDTQFELVAKTQEQILYDSAYPSNRKTHSNFWGKRPPH